MGLGAYPAISLAEARDLALLAKRQVIASIDPIDERRRERQENSAKPTFASCAEQYIDAHKAGWQNAKHAAQWASTLDTYAHPKIGGLSVDQVGTRHILDVLQSIWTTKTETASRVRGRIENILDWAKVQGFRAGENPARWRGHLDKLLAAPSKVTSVRHHPALPYTELPEFMADLRGRSGIGALALEFTILTAVRSGETRLADWSEFDLESQLWVIPPRRMKARQEHRVPLSGRVVEILKHVRSFSDSALVFPGARFGRPLSDMSLTAVLRRMGRGNLTVHGFRSTFRDWAGDRTSFPPDVAEAALAHSIRNKVEAAYRRGDALEKRRKLMDQWAAYCQSHGQMASVTELAGWK